MSSYNNIYECSVTHCRLKPKRHTFSYRVFMLWVNIENLPQLASTTWGLSHNRWNLFSINDHDHIDLGLSGGIAPNLLAWLEQHGKTFVKKPSIYLMTFPSVLGYGFNPISFYYLYSDEQQLLAVVAEVVNTFREMKLFLIDACDAHGWWHRRVAKNFYVSPFSDPGLEFDFKIGVPKKKWSVRIDDYEAGERIFLSAIHGEARSFSSRRLLWYFLKYPFLSLRIIGLIHWHAFLLWRKKVPFFQKSDRSEAQCDVLRPYR
ncbi:MAG: DUF1365 domain-containing protein [Chthoniobacterales bacterium]